MKMDSHNSFNRSIFNHQENIVAPWFKSYSLFVGFSVLFLSFVGIPANGLSILIFLLPNFRHLSINILLLALSIADFCLLIIAMPIFIPHTMVEYLSSTLTAYKVHVLTATYLYPISTMFHCGSVWLLIVITFERWLAISRPLAVGYYCTRKRAMLAILVVTICAVSFNMVRFWNYRIHTDDSGVMKIELLLILNDDYRLWYVTVASQAVIYVIPLIVLITFYFLINRELKKARVARSKMMSSAQTADRRTTKMMSAVVIVFICCYSMSLLVQLIVASKLVQPSIGYALSDLNNLLVMTSAATTFLIYTIFSTRYRSAAKTILYRIVCRRSDPHYRSRLYSVVGTELISRGSILNLANSGGYRSSIAMLERSKERTCLIPPETSMRRHSSDCNIDNIHMTFTRNHSNTCYLDLEQADSVNYDVVEV